METKYNQENKEVAGTEKIDRQETSDPRSTTMDGFDYPLPEERIALHPLADRDHCKLLYRRRDGEIEDHIFKDLPSQLPTGAIMVFNDTKVIHARLRMRRATGALIEIFCLEPSVPADYQVSFSVTRTCRWNCLVGNAKKWKEGEILSAEIQPGSGLRLRAKMLSKGETSYEIEFDWDGGLSFAELIASLGEIPIPPYLNRASEKCDEEDYQTVYARHNGSVAAPTAGLHFTAETLEALAKTGIRERRVTLHVGAGTFRPVKSDTLAGHEMHAEFISVPVTLIKELAETESPIYAVGTTSVRTLESLYIAGCLAAEGKATDMVPQWYAYDPTRPQLSRKEALTALADTVEASGADRYTADTRIIITPPYRYMVVDGLVTNFHQPKSTLLLLVSALIGDDWRRVYDHALASGYRFLSYGDACLFEK